MTVRTEYISMPYNLTTEQRFDFMDNTCKNEIVIMEEIPKIMRIKLQGKYSPGITTCSSCNNNLENYPFENTIGFSSDKYGSSVLLWECPRCFEKNYFHLTEYVFVSFMNKLKENKLKFYKMNNNVIERV